MIFGALDTGSSFEGMGSSREAHFAALAEAAIFAIIAFLVLLTGRCGTEMLSFTGFAGSMYATSLLLCAGAFFVVLLVENCRVPADDPDQGLPAHQDCCSSPPQEVPSNIPPQGHRRRRKNSSAGKAATHYPDSSPGLYG